jgi:hypothetical protein
MLFELLLFCSSTPLFTCTFLFFSLTISLFVPCPHPHPRPHRARAQMDHRKPRDHRGTKRDEVLATDEAPGGYLILNRPRRQNALDLVRAGVNIDDVDAESVSVGTRVSSALGVYALVHVLRFRDVF